MRKSLNLRWFGNLMTLSWWDDLWLNEGFASYIEYKGVAQYHTDWDMEAQFLIEDLHPVMDLDSTLNSHPIVQPVEHPNQVPNSKCILNVVKNFTLFCCRLPKYSTQYRTKRVPQYCVCWNNFWVPMISAKEFPTF